LYFGFINYEKKKSKGCNRGIKTGTVEIGSHTWLCPWYAFVLSPKGKRLMTYVYPLLRVLIEQG
jgi:hypothetical protein